MKRYRLASWIMGLALILTLGAVPVLAAEENGGISPGDVIAGEAASKVPVTGISLSPTSLTLNVGSSAVLTAQVHPVNASEQTVTWASSDERVAVVDGSGMVTAVGAGQTVITASVAKSGFTASCVVVVKQSGSSADTYPPVVKKTEGGTTTVFPSEPTEGSIVTISAVPNVGYEVAEVSAVDQSGRAVSVRRHQDGTWAFKQPGSRVTVSVDFRRKPWVSPFPDVKKSDWFYDSVALACQEGLMNGTGQGFDPDGTVTRGTLMTILARMDGVDTAGGRTWYEKGMAWAVSAGVSDGANPEGVITREQAAVMLYRYAGSPAVSGDGLSQFPDGDQVAHWASRGMRWAVEEDLFQGGDQGLDPQGRTTRAELAAILSRFITLS